MRILLFRLLKCAAYTSVSRWNDSRFIENGLTECICLCLRLRSQYFRFDTFLFWYPTHSMSMCVCASCLKNDLLHSLSCVMAGSLLHSLGRSLTRSIKSIDRVVCVFCHTIHHPFVSLAIFAI